MSKSKTKRRRKDRQVRKQAKKLCLPLSYCDLVTNLESTMTLIGDLCITTYDHLESHQVSELGSIIETFIRERRAADAVIGRPTPSHFRYDDKFNQDVRRFRKLIGK